METRRIAIGDVEPSGDGDVELSCNELAGPAPPLVLIHGLTGHRDDFRTRMPDLAGLCRLLVPDLRGHGDFTKTGRSGSFGFAQLVDDLRAVLDACEVDRCHLLGHSFGGMVALRFVLAHPERVTSLVLMDTAPFSPQAFSLAAFEKGGAIARARGMAFLQERVERAARDNPRPSASDRQTEKWADVYWTHHRRRYGAMDPEGYGELGGTLVEQEPVTARLSEIRCPTTVLVGAEDEEFLAGAAALSAGIPGAVRVTLPDAGHHPQMESPDAWLAAVREHVQRVSGARGPG